MFPAGGDMMLCKSYLQYVTGIACSAQHKSHDRNTEQCLAMCKRWKGVKPSVKGEKAAAAPKVPYRVHEHLELVILCRTSGFYTSYIVHVYYL
jgi:hypothetical protein